ncbi:MULTISPECIES: hypothetical protein [unclassified Kitasatospora]|uniref:hypothetical protein n=1 Tax=unclassified Kitasatospora TaxID=2633591 RepID=UPI001ADFDDFE|nr:hypothetical protein [Kitasatospora sp. RG8]MBP0452434.1 hypothetical protein [Kitasatospora sp. RG8]
MDSTKRDRLTPYAVAGGPALMALYGGIRLLDGSRDPGPGWLVGHSLMLAGLLLFGPVLAALHGRLSPRGTAGRIGAGTLAGVAFAGLAASVVQIGIDLYVGAVAVDKADQHRLFDSIQSRPGVLPAFYSVGPLLFYVGLLALLVAASVGPARTLRWWSPVLVLCGVAMTAADLALIPPAAVLFLVALAPLAGFGGARRPAVA